MRGSAEETMERFEETDSQETLLRDDATEPGRANNSKLI